MRRRRALTLFVPLSLLALGACDAPTRPRRQDTTIATTAAAPATPEEALRAVGLTVPDTPLTMEDGIHLSDLDEWSVRIRFEADHDAIEAWIRDSFGEAHGLPVSSDGEPLSQRFHHDEIHRGARWFNGSNPSDPSATYTVLVSPEGTSVVVAAARTSR